MQTDAEVIALVVDESGDDHERGSKESTGVHCLVRLADGHVSLEPVESQEEFDRIAKDTGCFRRGRAIRDPETLEVIGYEMEQIGPTLSTARG